MFLFAEKKEGHLGKLVWRLKRRPENSEIYNFSCFSVEKRQVFDHVCGQNTGARICPLGHKKNHRDHRDHREHRDRDHKDHRDRIDRKAHRDHRDHKDHLAPVIFERPRGQIGVALEKASETL